MAIDLRDLFRWEGKVDRGRYALVGLVGFALKHNLDRIVAFLYGREWGPFNYWIPLDRAARFTSLPRADAQFLLVMALLSLPFIWVGIAFTLRRLRSIGWPSWPVVFFFLPFGNLAFFLLLSLMPSRDAQALEPRPGFLSRLIPGSQVGSAAMAVLLTLLLGIAAGAISLQVFEDYGWSLFIALPFCLGLTSVLLYGYHEPRRWTACTFVSVLSVALLGVAFIALLFEGLICLAMAAPIMLPLALIGGWVGYVIQRRPRSAGASAQAPAMLLFAVLVAPLLMGAEHLVAPAPPVYEATTTIEIAASPEVVWRNVIAFSELPPPTEWIFRTGISYPVRAEIRGHGVGAVRA